MFPAKARAGDAILYDYATVHRGEPNTSDRLRPIAYCLYAKAGSGFADAGNFAAASLATFDPAPAGLQVGI